MPCGRHRHRAFEPVELTQLRDLGLGIPGNALAAVADLVHQRAERGEALVDVRVVAFDHRHLRRGLAGDQLALTLLPLLHVERLRQLGRGVVHQRRQHHFLLDAQVADADFAEFLGKALVDLPVAARLPDRVHRGRQRVDEGVHVAGVEVVLLVPAGGRQHDVAVQAGRAHAEVERDQQVELAFGRLVVPDDLVGLASSSPRSLPCTPFSVPSRCLQKYSWPLPLEPSRLERQTNRLRGQFCGCVRVFAAHLQSSRPSSALTT